MRLVAAAVTVLAVGVAGASSRPPPPSYALPSWSEDGTQLFFVSARGPAGAVHAAGVNGRGMRRLFRTGILSEVAWSPRDDWVAYSSRGRVVMLQPGAGSRRVVGSGVDLAWSPDGGRLAFSRSAGIGEPEYVYLVGADGAGLERLGPQGATPAWSPGGVRLAFWQRVSEGVQLAVYSFADAQVQVLTRPLPAFSRAPRWSPDGTHLLVTVCSAFGACRVEVAGADGSVVRRVATGGDPAWSPDGTRIAFSTRRSCAASGIFVTKADGTALRRITSCR